MRICCKLQSVSSCSALEDQNSTFQRKTCCFFSADICHSLARGQMFPVPLMILMRPDFFQLVCLSLINQDVGKKYMMIYKKHMMIYNVLMVWVTEVLFFYFLSVTVCYGSRLPKAPLALGVSIYFGYWCVGKHSTSAALCLARFADSLLTRKSISFKFLKQAVLILHICHEWGMQLLTGEGEGPTVEAKRNINFFCPH